jgi:prepilin-type processing-associated H-X9-DG protein
MGTRCSRLKEHGLSALEGRFLLFIFVFLVIFVYPMFVGPKLRHDRTSCKYRLGHSAISALIYAGDYDGRFPDATAWMDRLTNYVKDRNVFNDFEEETKFGYGYAFRTRASRVQINSIDPMERLVLIFDSTKGSRNAAADLESLPNPGRHGGFNTLAFADGHAARARSPAGGQSIAEGIAEADAKVKLRH